MMKSQAIPLSHAWEMNTFFVQYIHMDLIIFNLSSYVSGQSDCGRISHIACVSVGLILLTNGPKVGEQ